jgi:hypothetical protein
MALLFVAVIVGYSWYFERINSEVYSTKIAKTLLMNGSVPGADDISREQLEAEILGEMGADKKKTDDSEYLNPALEHAGTSQGNPYQINPNLGINSALNAELGGNNAAMSALAGAESSGIDPSAANQGGSFSSPSQMLANKYNGSSSGQPNSTKSPNGPPKASFADPTDSGASQGMTQQQIQAQDAQNQIAEMKPEYSGYYQVKIKTSGGSDYDTYAVVKEDGSGNLKITGEYARTKFSLDGELTQATTGTGTWLVNLKRNKFFQGLARITIKKAAQGYEMSGKISVSTNFIARKGKARATVEGLKVSNDEPETQSNPLDGLAAKVSFIAPDKPFNEPTPAASGLASMIAAMSAIVAGMSAAKRKNKAGRKGEILPPTIEPSEAYEIRAEQFAQEGSVQTEEPIAEPEPPKKAKGAVIKLSRQKNDQDNANNDISEQSADVVEKPISNLPAIIYHRNSEQKDKEDLNNDQ